MGESKDSTGLGTQHDDDDDEPYIYKFSIFIILSFLLLKSTNGYMFTYNVCECIWIHMYFENKF